MIKKIGSKWILCTRDGSKILGRHKTKKEAQRQESAINIAKARRTGYKINKK